ncbi:hypothetical protein BU17DRAFT_90989 [Hysterangium stoloniferum]|nr:hypothetical protein BU17DRAFT_90989 [Hysterangium stoloniferum]
MFSLNAAVTSILLFISLGTSAPLPFPQAASSSFSTTTTVPTTPAVLPTPSVPPPVTFGDTIIPSEGGTFAQFIAEPAAHQPSHGLTVDSLPNSEKIGNNPVTGSQEDPEGPDAASPPKGKKGSFQEFNVMPGGFHFKNAGGSSTFRRDALDVPPFEPMIE